MTVSDWALPSSALGRRSQLESGRGTGSVEGSDSVRVRTPEFRRSSKLAIAESAFYGDSWLLSVLL